MPGGRSRRSAARWAVSGEARQVLSRGKKNCQFKSEIGAEGGVVPAGHMWRRSLDNLESSFRFRARSGLRLGVVVAVLLSGKGVGKNARQRRASGFCTCACVQQGVRLNVTMRAQASGAALSTSKSPL